jgi:hypothetical protein
MELSSHMKFAVKGQMRLTVWEFIENSRATVKYQG